MDKRREHWAALKKRAVSPRPISAAASAATSRDILTYRQRNAKAN